MTTATTKSDTAKDLDDLVLETPKAEDLAALLVGQERPRRPSAISASVTFGWRAMLKIKHVPEQLFDVTAFPIMMVLMYTYLFGGALAGSTQEYIQFLLPGILTMSIVMITMYTGIAVNTDISKGVFDRFRTLPIWRPAPMVGYLLGDLIRYCIGSVVILAVGMLIGYRPDGGFVGVVLGVALLLVFAFSFSWVWTMFGLMLRTEKSVMGVSMMIIFPLTFLSNIFVDPKTMPGWLQAFVNNSPVTHVASAVRELMAGEWPAADIAWTLGWSVALVTVFGTITMRLYNRK
ncbi:MULTISPECIES: ABC transporter permease [Streptomyces]|uniref:Transport permease protein n=1 Tax=Streptomyces tsukubensis (strain DSM 42081 / NBRC 108919 / NRRL 18488 / 9993) TaxID=1114943 RepID=I2N2C1_STRT9|nr:MULTISPECIES: ABC transporter permease [Streptomyces]AZK95317.1 ABC transporter [Streptomyces tsukubensis]EIF91168.1 ABC transporter permease [Streptomyces tsukubensis NRRL18488]MYS62936.1 ABC transporter permease [Streptomyces sp. SID5473]QKM68629.1 ABC transporter permease [Streptomyces tsukubensis NRRL18488]TAI43436.1 ABC transporter permease [Streptomyces tsukubensis]